MTPSDIYYPSVHILGVKPDEEVNKTVDYIHGSDSSHTPTDFLYKLNGQLLSSCQHSGDTFSLLTARDKTPFYSSFWTCNCKQVRGTYSERLGL